MRQWKLLISFLFLAIFAVNVYAAVSPTSSVFTNNKTSQTVYKVGVIDAVPFSNQGETGKFKGFAVSIWRALAKQGKLNYQFVNAGDSPSQAIKAMNQGKYDLLIGPISVTTQRLAQATFSRPFYINKLSMITFKRKEGFWSVAWHMIKTFFGWSMLGYLILLLIFTFLHWLFERLGHVEEYEGKVYRSFIYSLWINTTAFLTNGYEQSPQSKSARLVMIFWMLISVIFLSQVTATITSALTISNSTLHLSGQDLERSLYQKNVAAQTGSYAEGVAHRLGANLTTTNDLSQAFNLLSSGKVNAVLGNYLTLKYYVRANINKDFEPSPITIGTNEMAFAFPRKSQLVAPVNMALAYLQDNNIVFGVCEKYLDAEDSEDCVI